MPSLEFSYSRKESMVDIEINPTANSMGLEVNACTCSPLRSFDGLVQLVHGHNYLLHSWITQPGLTEMRAHAGQHNYLHKIIAFKFWDRRIITTNKNYKLHWRIIPINSTFASHLTIPMYLPLSIMPSFLRRITRRFVGMITKS